MIKRFKNKYILVKLTRRVTNLEKKSITEKNLSLQNEGGNAYQPILTDRTISNMAERIDLPN